MEGTFFVTFQKQNNKNRKEEDGRKAHRKANEDIYRQRDRKSRGGCAEGNSWNRRTHSDFLFGRI
jgi:hypothetical protein